MHETRVPLDSAQPAVRAAEECGMADSALFKIGRFLLDAFGEFLSPPACVACDAPIRRGTDFCEACAASVLPWSEDGGTHDHLAAFHYGGAVATAIARLKYRGRADLARRLGGSMVAALTNPPSRPRPSFEMIVPVPLHPCRLAERGYNQAALLAAPLASRLSIPLAARALARVRHTPPQTNLDRVRRVANVAGAFRCVSARVVKGRRILLVDDVRTTGATLDAARLALEQSGVAHIVTLTLARATAL